MTGGELRQHLWLLGVSHRWFAARLGVHETTVYRWISGDRVPEYAAFAVALMRSLTPSMLAEVLTNW